MGEAPKEANINSHEVKISSCEALAGVRRAQKACHSLKLPELNLTPYNII